MAGQPRPAEAPHGSAPGSPEGRAAAGVPAPQGPAAPLPHLRGGTHRPTAHVAVTFQTWMSLFSGLTSSLFPVWLPETPANRGSASTGGWVRGGTLGSPGLLPPPSWPRGHRIRNKWKAAPVHPRPGFTPGLIRTRRDAPGTRQSLGHRHLHLLTVTPRAALTTAKKIKLTENDNLSNPTRPDFSSFL